MKWIGLLGGMSIESSIAYERMITDEVRVRLGGTSSPRLIHLAVDFAEVEQLQEAGDWDGAASLLTSAALRLQSAGAELIVLCTNTMHRVADAIQAAVDLPFLHIADVTAQALEDAGVKTVALLGTRYTMEQPFYRGRLEGHGFNVLVPDEPDRTIIHDVIYDELVRGVINPASRLAFIEVAQRLIAAGAEGVVAGCTEIELLLHPADIRVPYFPTTKLHVLAAVDAALTA